MSSPRSYLYVPGDRPERFAKAVASGADAVILDLEDAVAPGQKAAARDHVVAYLADAAPRPQLWVRINSGAAAGADLQALASCSSLSGVVVPKAEPAALVAAHDALPGARLCALVETARALTSLAALATTVARVHLALGEVDLAADLGLDHDSPDAALWALRMPVVVAAAAAGLAAPIGPVFADLGDEEGLRRTTAELRQAGFWSRQAIHPAQIATIHECLTPSAHEVAEATRLLERADAAGSGAWRDDDGRMVDEAVLRSARRTIELARPAAPDDEHDHGKEPRR